MKDKAGNFTSIVLQSQYCMYNIIQFIYAAKQNNAYYLKQNYYGAIATSQILKSFFNTKMSNFEIVICSLLTHID